MDLGPQFRLFCLALRRPQSDDDLRQMRELAARLEDWKPIVLGARRHRVASLALMGLRACDSPHLPAEMLAELNRLSFVAARRSLAQGAEVRRLCTLFSEAGVRVLVLKGVALSVQLYGEPGRRQARDIDLLVDPEQVLQAQNVLAKAGYKQRQSFSSTRQRATYLRFVKEIEFAHESNGQLVELHHRLTDNPNLLPLEFASLWNEREEVPLAGGAVSTLPRRHLPLYLCVHGDDHAWSRLQWLVDFASALSQSQVIDDLVETADAGGLRWPFLHAVMLAHDWLGLPIDDFQVAAYRNHVQVQRLDYLLTRLYSPADWYEEAPSGSWKRLLRHSLWERLYRFSLKSDWHYRTAQLRRAWVSPADWDTVPLPEALSWLYPLMRPWLWLLRRRRQARSRDRTLHSQLALRQRRQPE